MRRQLALSLILATGLYGTHAYSDRAISIVIDSNSNGGMYGGLKLANPSAVPVNFDLTCTHPSGFQMMNSNGVTLAPNTMSTFGNNNGYMNNQVCANGATAVATGGASVYYPSNNMGNGWGSFGGTAYACDASASISYANRAQACGPTMHVCTIDEMPNVYPQALAQGTNPKTYWIDAGSQTNFNYSTDSFATSQTSPTGTVPRVTIYAYMDTQGDTAYNNACRSSITLPGNPPPAPMTTPSCAAVSTATTATGTLCCYYNPDFSQGGMCKVNIRGTTPSGGFLQSPSFKGGAPF